MQPTTTCGKPTPEMALVQQLGRPVVVIASRERDLWLAEVAALGAVRKARCLHTMDRQVQELLGTDEVDYQFHTGDEQLDQLVRQIRLARKAVQLQEERIRTLTERILLWPNGGSGRDLAVLVGLSHQRVSHLLRQNVSTVDGEAQ